MTTSGLSCRLFLLPIVFTLRLGAADLRVGIIGTDISHVTQFTRILNNASDPEHVAGARVVAAYKGGSQDIVSSRTRVDNFERELVKNWGIEMVPDIPTLCSKVDAVLLESGDGRIHLAQVKPVIAAHKPVFIDKPLAATLEDAREIDRLARAAGVPWFSASSERYSDIANQMKFPDSTGADVWGPGPFEEHHYLELAWYAIHPIEILYTLLGPGCVEVTRIQGGDYTSGSDVIVGRWKDGRIGTVRANRPYGDFGAVVFRPKQILQSPAKTSHSYAPLVEQIVTFFRTGTPPVANQETLEIYAFIDAAQRSKEAGGQPARLR
jgi:hypothetical protein